MQRSLVVHIKCFISHNKSFSIYWLWQLHTLHSFYMKMMTFSLWINIYWKWGWNHYLDIAWNGLGSFFPQDMYKTTKQYRLNVSESDVVEFVFICLPKISKMSTNMSTHSLLVTRCLARVSRLFPRELFH